MLNLTTAKIHCTFVCTPHFQSDNFVVCSCAAIVKAMIVMLSVAPTRSMNLLSVKWLAMNCTSTWLVLLHILILKHLQSYYSVVCWTSDVHCPM